MLRKIKKKAAKLIRPRVDEYVQFGEAILPAKGLRYCGDEFKDDEYFFNSSVQEANRLIDNFGLNSDSVILDLGCGMGRLAIGILHQIEGMKAYYGVDISDRPIKWCQKYITSKNPHFQFQKLNVYNARYNPNGLVIDDDFTFPFAKNMFDIIYLYSVFSHMISDDVKVYLKEFKRILKPSGRIFLTAFVEEDVKPMEINPVNYKHEWTGELHCVLYNRRYIETLFQKVGFKVDNFEYETETDNQSGYYLSVIKG